MTSTAPSPAPGIEISCTKDGCDWTGSPADAPGHACPTTAGIAAPAAGPFAGMTSADGTPVEGATDPAHRYAVVWADGAGQSVTVGTARDQDAALKIVGMTAAGTGTVEIIDRGPALALAATLEDPEPGETVTIAAEANPETLDELRDWLLQHGQYDDAGIPQDEKTATLDARLSGLEEVIAAAEPELEIDETIEGEPVETLTADETPIDEERPELEPEDEELPAAATAADEPETGKRPLEVVIADELSNQSGVASYRWLVIWEPEHEHREAELIGRGRTKADAEEILENVLERGELTGNVTVRKTQEILELAAALEIEPKREQVEDSPETTVPTPAPPTDEPETEKDETEKDDEKRETGTRPTLVDPPAPTREGELFDRSAYDREDLTIEKIDGNQVDRIAVALSGEIMLDRSSPDDVALYNALTLNKPVELRVAGRVNGTGAKGATNREGDLDVVVGKKSVKVETVYVLTPEDL